MYNWLDRSEAPGEAAGGAGLPHPPNTSTPAAIPHAACLMFMVSSLLVVL
jgi:hypothetical protein